MRVKGASSETRGDEQATDFVMASHPIFTRDMDVFAHELLFRKCREDECAVIDNFDDATNKIIADGFALASNRLGKQGLLSVNVGYDNIMSKFVLALPPGRVLLEVPGDVNASPDFLDVCKELRGSGYRFLVDNYVEANLGSRELVRLADYLKVPVDGADGQVIARIRKSLSGWGGKLVASRVESWEAFEGCKFLGFDYFQGFFFSYPKDMVGRKISSHKAARLNLMRLLSDEDVELSRVVDVISTDQALSVRLLQFVNSVAFSLGNRVDSLGRAASLVGLNTLKKWAMAAALSDVDPSDRGVELSGRTMQGALFLGMLGDAHASNAPEADTLYLLGLLNNVDALMGMKMTDIVNDMPLKSGVKKALVRDEREPLTRYLMLLDAIWRNDWSEARAILHEVGVPLPRAAQLYMQAGHNMAELMGALSSATH
ncbi:MAG: hypothetical protein FD177_413 [Desulfovibrionaceae bacterium]|nr:MAG: hypothetical protein FD177_413 [Desulfovibrionaceae bacterium]